MRERVVADQSQRARCDATSSGLGNEDVADLGLLFVGLDGHQTDQAEKGSHVVQDREALAGSLLAPAGDCREPLSLESVGPRVGNAGVALDEKILAERRQPVEVQLGDRDELDDAVGEHGRILAERAEAAGRAAASSG